MSKMHIDVTSRHKWKKFENVIKNEKIKNDFRQKCEEFMNDKSNDYLYECFADFNVLKTSLVLCFQQEYMAGYFDVNGGEISEFVQYLVIADNGQII